MQCIKKLQITLILQQVRSDVKIGLTFKLGDKEIDYYCFFIFCFFVFLD